MDTVTDDRLREYAQLKEAIAQVERGEVAELDVNDVKRRGRLAIQACNAVTQSPQQYGSQPQRGESQ